nr:MAG TPA: hypothetical protein [Caudoviricetes sp.]
MIDTPMGQEKISQGYNPPASTLKRRPLKEDYPTNPPPPPSNKNRYKYSNNP